MTDLERKDTKTQNKKEKLIKNNQKESVKENKLIIKEIIEKENIKLTLNKQSSDEINSIYNAEIQYNEFKNWSSSHKIDGFRPGIVPLTEENQKKFINDTLSKIINDIDLSNSFAINYIQEYFKENEPILLTVTIERMPNIPDINFANYCIQSFKANITNDDIKKSIDAYRNIKATPSLLILDTAAKNGDFVKLEITVLNTGKKEIQEIRLGNFMIHPEIEAKLIGQKAGFTTLYTITTVSSVEIKILEVKNADVLTNDTIAKQLNIEIQQIENKFKEELEQNAHALEQKLIVESIFKIIAELEFLLPASILNQEYKEQYSEKLFNLNYNENTDELESFLKSRLNISLEEFERKLRNSTVFNAKLKFFLNYYAYKNNILASEEEINEAIKARLHYFKDDIKQARKYFTENDKARSNLIEQIVHPKILKKIQSIIKIEEPKNISLEELEQININDLIYTQINNKITN